MAGNWILVQRGPAGTPAAAASPAYFKRSYDPRFDAKLMDVVEFSVGSCDRPLPTSFAVVRKPLR